MRSVLAVLTVVLAVSADAATGGRAAARAYSFREVASGFDHPVYVTSAPGDATTLYVVEQPGTIEIVRGGRVAGTFLDIRSSVRFEGERGLLSMAFQPRYARNHLFYVDYTDLNGDTRVVEYTSANGVAVPSSARQLLFVKQPWPNHNGGQLQFDRGGYLYVGMGDGGHNGALDPTIGDPDNRAQNLSSRLGKLLRSDPTRHGARWRMIGYGLRNPWRFSFDRETGDLWIGDVGAGTWEEIDHRPKAQIGKLANYGWSRYEGDAIYSPNKPLRHKGKLVFPVWVYSHSSGCSVIGGYVYRGSRVPAARGRYFFGDYCAGGIQSFKAGNGRVFAVSPAGAVPQLTSFGEDGNGELYAVGEDGALYELR